MRTGNNKINCPQCGSNELSKDGKISHARNQKPLQRYKCKQCKKRFYFNSIRPSSRQRKPDLNKKVMDLYCEGNTLRGIGRILGCSYNTVVSKFRFMAKLARNEHLKKLSEGEIVTSYVQIDEMETLEKTRSNPLGIELAIRPKTYEIISAKVCRIHIKGQSVSSKVKEDYNSNTNRELAENELCVEVSKCSKSEGTIATDGKTPKSVSAFFTENQINSFEKFEDKEKYLWAINHVCAKLRNRISRLNRKTWATTKEATRLQDHLDLFIACQNGYKLKF